MSQTGIELLPWEDQSVRGKISHFFVMNWTDGKLNRNKHGKTTRAARHRHGQKQYFASILERRERKKMPDGNPPVLNPYMAPSGSPLHNPSQHPSRPGSSPSHRNGRPREASIYKDVPQTVDEFLKMFGSSRSGDDAHPSETRDDDEDLEAKRQRILAIPNPAPLPPMIPTKRRRLRGETKIIDWEEWGRQRRETLEHIAPESRAKVRMMMQSQNGGLNPPQAKDGVRIRIGSQEKRLGASSTITKPSQTLPVHTPAANKPHPDGVLASVKSSNDGEDMVIAHRNPMKRPTTTSSTPTTASNMPTTTSNTQHSMVTDSQIVEVGQDPQVKRRRISRKSPDFYKATPVLFQETYNSQDTNSAHAQVGRAVSPVTSHQRSENNVWRNWLKSASAAAHTSKAVDGSAGSSQWPPVSPGISEAYPIVRGQVRPLPDLSDSPQGLDEFDQQIWDRNEAFDELISGDSSFILNWDDDLPRAKELSRQFKADEPPSRTPHGRNAQLCFDGIGGKGNEVPTRTLAPQAGYPESPTGDPEEAWGAFIFRGDSDEIEQSAFEEAGHDAALGKRPSYSPSPNSDPGMSEYGSNIATIGSVYMNVKQGISSESDGSEEVEDSISEHGSDAATVGTLDINHELQSESVHAPEETEASISESETGRDGQSELNAESEVDETFTGHEEAGTVMSSSAKEIVSDTSYDTSGSTTQYLTIEAQERISISPEGVTSDPAYDASGSNTDTPTTEWQVARSLSPEVGISGTETRVSDPVVSTDISSGSLHELQIDSASSDMGSMVVEPPKPEMRTTKPKDDFRFAPPKLFVGNRSKGLQPRPPRAVAATLTFAKRRGGRQRKRAGDGRADIRALPNYTSDPIEEIEDDDEVQDSRFGMLELG